MEQRVKNNIPKSQGHSQIIVVTDWQVTQEMSPAFRQLMLSLLKERTENGENTAKRESDRPNR